MKLQKSEHNGNSDMPQLQPCGANNFDDTKLLEMLNDNNYKILNGEIKISAEVVLPVMTLRCILSGLSSVESNDRQLINQLVGKLWPENTLAVRSLNGKKPRNRPATGYKALTPDKLRFVEGTSNFDLCLFIAKHNFLILRKYLQFFCII